MSNMQARQATIHRKTSEQINSYIENVNHYKNPQELIHYFSGQLDGIMQSGKKGASS